MDMEINGPITHGDTEVEDLMLAYYESQKINADPIITKAFRKLAGQNNDLADLIQKKADERVKNVNKMA